MTTLPPLDRHWTLPITGMSCASCAGRVEKGLQATPSVHQASVNLAAETAYVAADTAVSGVDLLAAVSRAGYRVVTHTLTLGMPGLHHAADSARVQAALLALPDIVDARVNLIAENVTLTRLGPPSTLNDIRATIARSGFTMVAPEAQTETKPRPDRESLWIGLALAFSAPLVVPMLFAWLGVHVMLNGYLQWGLASVVQFGFGWRFYRGAWQALRAGSTNMDVLVALGTSAAYGLSVYMLLVSPHAASHLYFEASAVVMSLVMLGKGLERRAKKQTLAALDALRALQPQVAHVRRHNRATQSDVELDLPADQLKLGDILIIRPGEAIPADSLVLEGRSEVDESLLSGESLPVTKESGDILTGGAINGTGRLVARTTALGNATTLARLIALIVASQAQKAPIQHLVDRVSAIFVPVVLGLSALTLLAWGFGTGDWAHAILNAVAVLVIACPCALGLATPTAMMVGTGAAAKHGILIKNAHTLERAQAITAVAFDKTGTLTMGHPTLTHYQAANPNAQDDTALLTLAAAMQADSAHPLGKAVCAAAAARGLALPTVTDLHTVPGLGLTATLANTPFALGNSRMMADYGIDLGALAAHAATLSQAGHTVSWLAQRGAAPELIGLLAFSDTLKPSAAQALIHLHQQGIYTVLLTGDNLGSAQAMDAQLRQQGATLDAIHANLLPADKVSVLQALRQKGYHLAMVGDGMNDAPALAAADLGIAMASGTDLTMQVADITLRHSDPERVADALDIARRTYRKIRQNLFWAFVYNLIGLPLAAFGLLNPVWAGLAMALSSVSVIANALLLSRWKPHA